MVEHQLPSPGEASEYHIIGSLLGLPSCFLLTVGKQENEVIDDLLSITTSLLSVFFPQYVFGLYLGLC